MAEVALEVAPEHTALLKELEQVEPAKNRSYEWLKPVILCLIDNGRSQSCACKFVIFSLLGVEELADLVGANLETFSSKPGKGAHQAFLTRVLDHVTPKPQPAPQVCIIILLLRSSLAFYVLGGGRHARKLAGSFATTTGASVC